VWGQLRPQGRIISPVVHVGEMPWIACWSMAFSTVEAPGQAVDRMRFTAFFIGL
jgi:hypothetical protein